MRTLSCDIVIVGAGVAGGFLACVLRDSGLRVIVVDQHKRIPDINRGDQVAPCTVRMLAAIGALPNFEKQGSIRINHWKALGPDGETVSDVPIAVTAPPPHNYILGLPHTRIHAALLETATESTNVTLIRGLRVTGLVHAADGTVCGVNGRQDDGEVQINATLVAGCDGPGSFVREAAGIHTDVHTYAAEYLMLTASASPAQPADTMVEIWGAEGYGGIFPLAPGLVRCPVQAAPGVITRWRAAGLDKLHAELARRFPYYAQMKLLDRELYTYKIIRHHAETYVGAGVVLLGDAAHCTSPFYGMGMNMGMRDGYQLSKVIVPLLQAGATPSRAALAPYEAACRTFNQFVINASDGYDAVASSKRRTTAEVRKALARGSALDPNVMSIIYADYDAAPPVHADPVAIAAHYRGTAALELTSTVLLDGLTFVEAPRWHDERLWFVDFFSKNVLTVDLQGRREVIATVAATPGGLGFLPDGTPLVVSQADFKLMAIGAGGRLTEYADLSRYARGMANELLVDTQGRCYVGHHGFDFFGGAPLEPASLILVDTAGTVSEAADQLIFPNGTAITPDGRTLIVAETFANRLTAFDVAADGGLSNRRPWAELGKQWTPDGICLDADGAAWVANPLAGAILRVREGGAISHRIAVGKWAIACALGGPDRRTLFCLTSETTMATMPQGLCKGFVEIVRVDVPGVGLP